MRLYSSQLRVDCSSIISTVTAQHHVWNHSSMARGSAVCREYCCKQDNHTICAYSFAVKNLRHYWPILFRVTVGTNILNMISIFTPSFFTGGGTSAFMVPCVAVTNIMACMVYRQLKLGILPKDPWDQSERPSVDMMLGWHSARWRKSGLEG